MYPIALQRVNFGRVPALLAKWRTSRRLVSNLRGALAFRFARRSSRLGVLRPGGVPRPVRCPRCGRASFCASADVQSAVASTPRPPAASPSRGRRAARGSTRRRTQPEGSTNRARPYREDSETVQLLRNDRGQGSRPAASAFRVRGQGRCPKIGHYCGGRTDKHLPRVGNRMDTSVGQRDGIGIGCHASSAKDAFEATAAG
jgi:hypothetical protein